MSFVKKAVKKVFKFTKRLVKKTVDFTKRALQNRWVQTALLVGATLFTAGLGGAGWAGFKAAWGATGNTLGGFFSTVGSTIAQGFTNVVSSVSSLFKGAGTATSTTSTAANLATPTIEAIASQGVTSTAGGVLQAGFTQATTQATQQGFLSRLASGFGKLLTADSAGGSALRNGIIGGINFLSKRDELEWEKEKWRMRTIAGGPAVGGSSELPEGHIRRPVFGSNQNQALLAASETSSGESAARPVKRVDPFGTPEAAASLLGTSTPIPQFEPAPDELNSPLLGVA